MTTDVGETPSAAVHVVPTSETERLSALLGPDLIALASSPTSALTKATPITGLPIRGLNRATFRLRYADGTMLKGRRMESAEDARRVFDLTREFDSHGFGRPIVQHGSALLEPWIVGRQFGDESDAVFERCGALLGSVHAIRHDLGSDATRWLPERRLADIEHRLDQLVELAALDRKTADRLVRIAGDARPSDSPTGIVHRDLWPRNIVIDEAGSPWIIDNGNVALGARAFDLARTEYLWPMAEPQHRAFMSGYSQAAPGPMTTSPFWAIDVQTEVALFRAIHGAPGVRRPVAGLRRLAATR